jgi:hypothetical protein
LHRFFSLRFPPILPQSYFSRNVLERLKRMRMNNLKGELPNLLDEQERLQTEMDAEKKQRQVVVKVIRKNL